MEEIVQRCRCGNNQPCVPTPPIVLVVDIANQCLVFALLISMDRYDLGAISLPVAGRVL